MKNKVIILVALVCLVAAVFIFKSKSGPPKATGPNAEQIEKDRASLQKSDASEVEVYESLNRLASNKDQVALDTALERSNHESRMVREGTASALGYFTEDRAFDGLKKLLNDKEENVRIRTMQALASAPEPRRIKLLNEYIVSEKATVREKSIGHSVLLKMLPPTDEARKLSIDYLVSFVKAGDSLEEYIAYSKLLEVVPNEKPVLDLVRSKIESGKNQEMVAQGIRQLGSIKDPWLAPRLSGLLKHSNADVRAAAEQARDQLANK